jgi:hypothetical protein
MPSADALRVLCSSDNTVDSRTSKSKPQHVCVRKGGATSGSVCQVVEKREDHYGRKFDMYKRVNDAPVGQSGGDLDDWIVVCKRQHREEGHGIRE